MAPRVRVRLNPLPSPFGAENQFLSDGALVALETLGPFGSDLEPGAEVAAKLSFEARFVDRLRGEDEPQIVPLATLEGRLLRDPKAPEQLRFEGDLDAAGKPVGLVPVEAIDEDAPPEPEAEDPKDEVQIRVLRFLFDTVQFANANQKLSEPDELLVRMKPKRFHHCELSVALELSGVEEAPRDSNDLLDVLITARNPGRRLKVVLRLTDLKGEPLPNARCAIVSGARPADETADPTALAADGEGLVRLKALLGTESFEVEWRPADSDLPRFRRKLFVELGLDPTEADQRRLNNVGYTAEFVRQNVLAFQSDFERESTGHLSDIRKDLRAWHDDGVKPKPGAAS